MPSDIKVTRAPPGTHSFTQKDLNYLDSGIFDLGKTRAYTGGIEIARRSAFEGSFRAAIPSTLAAELHVLMFNPNQNSTGGAQSRDRAKSARKEIMSKYLGGGVLLDLTADKEEYLRRVMNTDQDIGSMLMGNTRAMPKAYMDWNPYHSELAISGNGLRLVLKDNAKRAFVKILVGDFDEAALKKDTNGSVNKLGDGSASAPIDLTISELEPMTPAKRKAEDKGRVAAAAAKVPHPFKQARIQRDLTVDVAHGPLAQNAKTRMLDSKVYDPRKVRPIAGGFQIALSSSGFGRNPMAMGGLTFTNMAVPSDLAIHFRDKFLAAANSSDRKLGLGADERGQNAVRELTRGWVTAPEDFVLLNITSRDDHRILGANQRGRKYTSVAHALREDPLLFDTISTFLDWDPRTTTLELLLNGQIKILFMDDRRRVLISCVLSDKA